MTRSGLIAPILIAIWFGDWTIGGPQGATAIAQAQSSGRDGRTDGDREQRRDSQRGRFGRSDGYRRGDWRNRGREDDAREDDARDDESRSERGSSPAASTVPSSSRTATSATSGATSLNTTDYARSLVKKHDKNANMMLEASEQGELRGRSAAADSNNDKVITVDELVAQLSGSSSTVTSRAGSSKATDDDRGSRENLGSASSGSSDTGRRSGRSEDGNPQRVFTGSAGGKQSGSGELTDKRHSYRFTPPSERLPTGLPSWFKSRDKNRDGQVAMSEYVRTWSTRLVDEFRRYDSNDDGIITPKEVAKK